MPEYETVSIMMTRAAWMARRKNLMQLRRHVENLPGGIERDRRAEWYDTIDFMIDAIDHDCQFKPDTPKG